MSDKKNESPAVKAAREMYEARVTGVNRSGTHAGQVGADQARRDRDSKSSKVICTELHRQGLLSRADYDLGYAYARDHLSARHQRGYHLWAVPAVRHMRKSRRASAFWRYLAQARTDHIAFVNGDRSRRNLLGAALCLIGHPLCYALGMIAVETDWRGLYDGLVAHRDGRRTH